MGYNLYLESKFYKDNLKIELTENNLPINFRSIIGGYLIIFKTTGYYPNEELTSPDINILKILVDYCIKNGKIISKTDLEVIIRLFYGSDSITYYNFINDYEDIEFNYEENKELIFKLNKWLEIGMKFDCILSVF